MILFNGKSSVIANLKIDRRLSVNCDAHKWVIWKTIVCEFITDRISSSFWRENLSNDRSNRWETSADEVVLLKIFSNLKFEDLFRCALVNTALNNRPSFTFWTIFWLPVHIISALY